MNVVATLARNVVTTLICRQCTMFQQNYAEVEPTLYQRCGNSVLTLVLRIEIRPQYNIRATLCEHCGWLTDWLSVLYLYKTTSAKAQNTLTSVKYGRSRMAERPLWCKILVSIRGIAVLIGLPCCISQDQKRLAPDTGQGLNTKQCHPDRNGQNSSCNTSIRQCQYSAVKRPFCSNLQPS